MRISDWSSDVCSSDLKEFLRKCTMVMIHDGNIDIFYLEIHCQGQDDQLDAGHGKHHGKNCLVAEDLPEFLLHYESQNLNDSRILKFFNARSEERRVGKVCVSTCRSG